jgi:hypothetical protein
MKILKTNSSNYPEIITRLASAGLVKLWNHMLNGPFAIISAHNGKDNITEEGRAKNNERQGKLKQEIANAGFGFFDMKGVWENSELSKYIPEKSLFVIGIDESATHELANLYQQEAYIWGDMGSFIVRETKTGNALVQGNVKDCFRQLTPQDLKEIEQRQEGRPFGYSEIQGRKWILDRDAKTKAQQKKKDLEQRKKEDTDIGVGVEKKASFDIVYPTGFFYSFEHPVKYLARWYGVIRYEDTAEDVPARQSLSAYIPLIEK